MNNKGCIDCANYVRGSLSFDKDGNIIDGKPRQCLIGNTDLMNTWWEENKHTKHDETSPMNCYKETVLSEMVNEMSHILDELKKILDENESSCNL